MFYLFKRLTTEYGAVLYDAKNLIVLQYCLLNDKKIRSKCLVLGPGARKNFSVIELYTTWIPFNDLSRTRLLLLF